MCCLQLVCKVVDFKRLTTTSFDYQNVGTIAVCQCRLHFVQEKTYIHVYIDKARFTWYNEKTTDISSENIS